MAGEFVDYKKSPGFWFYLELLLAVDICENPVLSAKNSDFATYGKDLFEVFDSGLYAYQLLHSLTNKEWGL